MPTFGANAFNWIDDWTTEKGNYAIAEAARMGFDLIEIPMMHPWDFDPKAHRDHLAQHPIGITASLILPEDAHMPSHPREAKQFLLKVLENLEAVGGTTLCGCIAFAGGVFTGQPPTDQELQVVIDTLGEVVLDAQQRGISVGIECVNRYETYLINTLEDGRRVVKAINQENCFLHGDTYHMNIEEENFYQPIVDSAGLLRYIHLSESHRGLIGSGTVNWDEVFRGLAEIQFTGPLVLESFSANNPDLIAAVRLWRAPKQSPEYLGTEGLKFLRRWADKVGLQ